MLPDDDPTDLAFRYRVGDLPDAKIAGARLRGILEKLAAGQRPSSLQFDFLNASGLSALAGLASGDIDQVSFQVAATSEQSLRLADQAQNAEAEAAAHVQAKEAATAERERLAATSAAYFDDPADKRRNAERELRRRYAMGYLEPDLYRRIIKILQVFDAGARIKPDDLLWMTENDLWTPDLQRANHRREAEALSVLWRQTKDPWHAVTASGHWRKAGEPEAALSVTDEVETRGLLPKLTSALLTTRGGALRDFACFGDVRFAFAEYGAM